MTAPQFPKALGQTFEAAGFFTQAGYLHGQSPDEIERRQGFRPGRLRAGYWRLYLTRLPSLAEFARRGYSQLSGGVDQRHLPEKADAPSAEARLAAKGFDLEKLKRLVLSETFTLSGERRLAKILPLAPEGPVHGDGRDAKEPEYPPGSGIPQWVLWARLPRQAAALVASGGRYLGGYD